jgi:hypothetical protein
VKAMPVLKRVTKTERKQWRKAASRDRAQLFDRAPITHLDLLRLLKALDDLEARLGESVKLNRSIRPTGLCP